MRARLVLLCSLASLMGLMPAQAFAQVVLDQWGTYATTVSSDCANFCDPDTDLSWFLGLTFGPQNGGEAIELSDSTISGVRGDAFAESSVLVGLGPTLRVDANALAGGWVDGTATAVEGYSYTGLVADTIEVTVHLTGTIGNPDADPSTGLAARVAYVGDANLASLLFENAILGLVAGDGAVELEQTADGVVDIVQVLSVPVAPGDQFYLVTSSAATAGGNGAFAESLGTLSVSFDASDAANLAVASGLEAAVPALRWPFLLLLPVALAVSGALVRKRWMMPTAA
jgi:hypothetical protein